MKTAEDILTDNCPVFSALFHDKTNKASVMMKESILKSMNEFANLKLSEYKASLIETIKAERQQAIEQQEQEQREEFYKGKEYCCNDIIATLTT